MKIKMFRILNIKIYTMHVYLLVIFINNSLLPQKFLILVGILSLIIGAFGLNAQWKIKRF